MRQEQKKKQKDRVAIVLMLCFCVIALTSIFTIKSNVQKINKSAQGNEVPASDQTKVPVSGQTKVPEKPAAGHGETPAKESGENQSPKENDETKDVSSQVPIVESAEKPNSHGAETNTEYLFPLESGQYKVTNPFSMTNLIYSVTLDQYMTHQGVDIEAPSGTSVVAVSEGTVTAVYTDDRFGESIEITHGNGTKTIYSNLDSTDKVEIGDVVSRGAVIAAVGKSGAFEALEPAHLHFEIIKDGKYVDPAEYIAF